MLNFACIVVIPGCTFLRRFIDLTKGIVKPHNYMNLTKELYKPRLSSLVLLRITYYLNCLSCEIMRLPFAELMLGFPF